MPGKENCLFHLLIGPALVIIAAGALGCVGISVSPTTKTPTANQPAAATILLGEMLPIGYDAMHRELGPLITEMGIAVKVVNERDLGPDGVEMPAFAIRLRVVEDKRVETDDGKRCTLPCPALAWTIVPLFFWGRCTTEEEHRLTIELRVFNLESASVAKLQDAKSNELLNVYDTATVAPLIRKEYQVKVIHTTGALATPTRDELLTLAREESKEVMRQVLALSFEDVTNALRSAGDRK